ncbi:MAG: SPFH domain-containing protein [Clostridia bacterium]|nr:SPFH domain-containing protein [Clostridia bacterium]
MGLFSYFKRMFNKNIENDEEYDGELVHLYSKNQTYFNIGYNIVVRPGFNAVFVVRDRVTDVLPSGKYRLSLEGLPITFHKLKLDRIGKKKMPTKFKADLYFVNTNPFKEIEFNGSKPYLNKTKEYGKVVAYGEGSVTLQVQEAGDFVSYLLVDRPYVTNKISLGICKDFIGNAVNKMLEKSNMTIKDIFKSPATAANYVNENINNELKNYGISVSEVQLKSFDIKNKVQQKINEKIEEEKTFVEDYIKVDPTSKIEEMEPKFVVENSEETLNQEEIHKEEVQPQPNDDFETINQEVQSVENPVVEQPQEQFTPPQDTSSPATITCPNCGEHIANNGHFCPNCGFNLDSLK